MCPGYKIVVYYHDCLNHFNVDISCYTLRKHSSLFAKLDILP